MFAPLQTGRKPYAAPYKASSIVHLPGGVVVALKSVLKDAHTTMHKKMH